MSDVRKARQAFAVLRVTPCGGPESPGTIKSLCEGIPGVGALRVDRDRGTIHVLYDGTVSAIEQVQHALRVLGLRLRHPGERPSSLHRMHKEAL